MLRLLGRAACIHPPRDEFRTGSPPWKLTNRRYYFIVFVWDDLILLRIIFKARERKVARPSSTNSASLVSIAKSSVYSSSLSSLQSSPSSSLFHSTLKNCLIDIHCGQKKTAPFYFCNNFVKSVFIPVVIGTHIP